MLEETNQAIQIVDTSFVMNLLITAGDSEIVQIWRQWEESNTEVGAPELLMYEVTNVIWQMERAGRISLSTANSALERFLSLEISMYESSPDQARAYELARRYRLGKTYDLFFVALAERLTSTLWTCDKRLRNAVSHSFSNIKVVKGDW